MSDANLHDRARPDATGPDYDFCLSVEEVADRYAIAGHPRTVRAIQRYCAKGHLDARKAQTNFGDKYLVAPYSVSRHIAQIDEIVRTTGSATGLDQPRQTATAVAKETLENLASPSAPGTTSGERPVATGPDMTAQTTVDARVIQLLERENEFLRTQIHTKDDQIKELTERSRETNFLIRGLQELFPTLGPARARTEPFNTTPPTQTAAQ